MKQIYIHVGMPKSGSSYLQLQVFPKLEGAYVVEERDPQAQRAVDRLSRESTDEAVAAARDAVRRVEATADSDVILFSAETLFRSERLPEVAPNARYILILRRQADLLESTYKQYLHGYSIYTVDEYIPTSNGRFTGTNPWPSPRDVDVEGMNHLALVQRYVDMVGESNILVLPYESLRRNHQAFVSRICDFMGVSSPDLPPAESVNRSYSLISCEVALVLNRFMVSGWHDKGFIRDRPFFRWLLARRQKGWLYRILFGISRRLSLRWFLQSVVDRIIYIPVQMIDDATRARIKDLHADTNRRLDEWLGLGLKDYGYY